MENSRNNSSTPSLLDNLSQDIRNTIFCVGSGYSREELKLVLLKKHRALFGKIVISPLELALSIAGIDAKMLISSRVEREELYEGLLKNIPSHRLPQLRRLKRRRSFFKALDKALQAGRLAFSNSSELETLLSLCEKDEARAQLQSEIKLFSIFWESFLNQLVLVDEPMVYTQALTKLRTGAWSSQSRVVVFHSEPLDILEKAFWDELRNHVTELIWYTKTSAPTSTPALQVESIRVHSPFEAVESLADHCYELLTEEKLQPTILIPDQAEIRQLLFKALKDRGIPIRDERNPGALRYSEQLKSSLLPFRVAVTNAEREVWLQYVAWTQGDGVAQELAKELVAMGFRNGTAFCLKKNSELLPFFSRMTFSKARDAHLKQVTQSEIQDLLNTVWESIGNSIERLGLMHQRAPAQYWLQKLQSRYEELRPPPELIRSKDGVIIHRLGQFPLDGNNAATLVLSLPSSWVLGSNIGDYFFSVRERERLSQEFQIRSHRLIVESRIQSLLAWVKHSKCFFSYEPEYSSSGKETESISWLWKTLNVKNILTKQPSHHRWAASYSPDLQAPTTKTQLSKPSRSEVSATAIDMQSRCGFLGLIYGRWKIEDLKEPDFTPWPTMRGILLHRAAREMIENNTDSRTGLAVALREVPWRGMFQSRKTIAQEEKNLLEILDAFLEKEVEYRERSGAVPKFLEGPAVTYEAQGLTIYGRPDRVDEHPDGLFVIDYKSSNKVPSGEEMVELGFRVQIPLYAIALQKQLGRPVLGGQFVELTKQARRARGILLAKYNGKEAGKLSKSQARSSIFKEEPETIWERCELHLERIAGSYAQGMHFSKPTLPDECEKCSARDACGRSRFDVDS